VRIAVLIKQVPRFEVMHLGSDGRLERDGLELEMNPYCRRAVSKGVELAAAHDGTCTVVTMGPPPAEDSLREAIAWGATSGVLICDPALAGSDTLATARALAAAVTMGEPFDLILTGRNSVDADTGQVGPELAQLLGVPFVGGVRSLELDEEGSLRARCEYDDGWVDMQTSLPAVLSCAERLCEPAKVDPPGRAAVAANRIQRLTAADLGDGPWGQAGSPTQVGDVRVLDAVRRRLVLSGAVDAQVRKAVDILADRGALGADPAGPPTGRSSASDASTIPEPSGVRPGSGPVIAVIVEPGRQRVGQEMLGAAAKLAEDIDGSVVVLALDAGAGAALGAGDTTAPPYRQWGADAALELTGSMVEEDVALAVGAWAESTRPWAVLAPGTMWGREVTARIAARLGAGLTGDAVDLDVADGRLVGWKPAFGGRLVAAITATSDVQLATVRPGVLALRSPRAPGPLEHRVLTVPALGRVRHLDAHRDDDVDTLLAAEVVIGVGAGVAPEDYPALEPLRLALGAELAATRKVTDRGWLPRSRQLGITGHSIGPRLYLAIGLSGKFNHMVGLRGAGEVLAINTEPGALVFDESDIGIVADWREAVPLLTAELDKRLANSN
jgi:electron transfer flavoprotein alpha subunit